MTTRTLATWQEELQGECRRRQYSAPVYNIVSDRRGGRTAWSATVTINSQNTAARYWYDGQYVNNAKEDAAEVACTRIRNPAITDALSGGFRSTATSMSTDEAREEEKIEPKEESLPEGALYMVGEEEGQILD